MVGGAFNAEHHFSVNGVFEVTLVHQSVVNEVLMFEPRMHPGCFMHVILLEYGVGDDKLPRSAKLRQKAPVVIAVTNTVSATYSFPGICILAHSSIEITKYYPLVVCSGDLETAAELQTELIFFCKFSSKSWRVHTEKRGIPLIFQRKAHGYDAVGMSGWQTMKPTFERCLSVIGFPGQKRVYTAPCSWRLPSHGKRTSLWAGKSTFNQDNSCAIRAASSMILTFHNATFLHPWRWVRTFPVLMFLDRLRKCPLTVASQLGDERRDSFRTTFLSPSPCEASRTVHKEGCLVVQSAARGFCHLRSTSDDQYPEMPSCGIETAASSEIFHRPFRPFPITT